MRLKIAIASVLSAVAAISGMYGVQKIHGEYAKYHKLEQAVLICGTQPDPKTGEVGWMSLACVAEGAR